MFSRSDRLKVLFQEEIAKALREVKDRGISGILTVTDLKLSADRKVARVYYSILGSQQQQLSSQQALERCAPFIRHLLRKRLAIKVIPEVVFVFDETPQKADRVEKLLRKIELDRIDPESEGR